MERVPELPPTRQMTDLAEQDFLLPWQAHIDSVGGDTAKMLANMALATTEEGANPYLHEHLAERGLASQILPSGLPETPLHYRSTPQGCESAALLGVYATWQLKHDVPLAAFTGQGSARLSRSLRGGMPYAYFPSAHLRILQLAVTQPAITATEAMSVTPARGRRSTYNTLKTFDDQGVLLALSRGQPAHRLIRLEDPQITAGRQIGHPIRKIMGIVGKSLYAEYGPVVNGQQLLDKLAEFKAVVNPGAVWRIISQEQPAYMRFDDDHIFGSGQGRRNVYGLSTYYRPVITDLLLGICSLQDAKYKKDATDAAHIILSSPDMVNAFVTPRPLPRANGEEDAKHIFTVGQSSAAKTKSTPDKSATGLRVAVGSTPEERLAKQVDRLVDYCALTTADSGSDAIPRIAFSAPLRARFKPVELMAIANHYGIDHLIYDTPTPLNHLEYAMGLQSQGLERHLASSLLPRFEAYLDTMNASAKA